MPTDNSGTVPAAPVPVPDPPVDPNAPGPRLLALRLACGLSQQDIEDAARDLGMPRMARNYLGRIENGEGTDEASLLDRKVQVEVFIKENGWPGVGNVIAARKPRGSK